MTKWHNTHSTFSIKSYLHFFARRTISMVIQSTSGTYMYPCTRLTTCISWSLLTHWALQKKQHLRPTKLMNINSQWQFLLERVFLYLVFCSIQWCCRVVVHEVIRDNKWLWPTGVANRTRGDFSQANLNFGDCYRSLHASF